LISAGRVALVHDRLDQNGGAERVLEALHEMFPQAPIFTSMWNRSKVTRFEGCDVRTSWMQLLPGISRAPRAYAALYPLAFAQIDLRGFDLIISSSSSFAHGIHTRTDALHICYCHSPSNFLWRPSGYFKSPTVRALAAPLRLWLKAWERRAATKPDYYIANGHEVAGRIRAFYHRDAAVVPPPIADAWFVPHDGDDFYLVVSRLVEQKRVDLAIRACERLRLPLWIVGEGRAGASLQANASPSTRFLGSVADDELRRLYSRARAVLVPAEEDFGLVALEAQAAGTPVIAFDAGGARETVVDGLTGIRFAPQTAESLARAITAAASRKWDRRIIQAHAARFTESRFKREIRELIERYVRERRSSAALEGRTYLGAV
jgi:glycosyltransferase involved in cell wall biosynthesis